MPFQKGFTGQEFKEKLLRFCSDEFIVNLYRGYHTCEFCNLSDFQWYNEQNGKYRGAHWASIGNGEIRVLGPSVVYVAPALVYHYVSEHQYRPPDEFIEAVLSGEADSKEQKELLSGTLSKDFDRVYSLVSLTYIEFLAYPDTNHSYCLLKTGP